MYQQNADLRVETQPDPWVPARYCIAVSADLVYSPAVIDEALRDMGYRPVDDDQWGRSYRRTGRSDLAAELDELEDPYWCNRLVLRYENLADQEKPQAEEELVLMYERLCEWLRQKNAEEYDEAPAELGADYAVPADVGGI